MLAKGSCRHITARNFAIGFSERACQPPRRDVFMQVMGDEFSKNSKPN